MRCVEEEAAVLLMWIRDEVIDAITMTGMTDITAKDVIADRLSVDIADRLTVVTVISERIMRISILGEIWTRVVGRTETVDIGVSLRAIALMNPYVSLVLTSLAAKPVMAED